MNLPKPRNKNRRRRLILPIALILLIGSGFLFSKLKNSSISFPQKMVNPSVDLSSEDKLKKLMGEYNLFPESIDFKNDIIIATFSGNLTAQLSPDNDLKLQVASLQFIISRSKIEGKVPKGIDLRFGNPVVLY